MDTTQITLSIAEVCYLQGIVKEQIKETQQLRSRMSADDPFRSTVTQHVDVFQRVLTKLERAERDLTDEDGQAQAYFDERHGPAANAGLI